MLLKNAFQNNFDMFGKWTDELECIVKKTLKILEAETNMLSSNMSANVSES